MTSSLIVILQKATDGVLALCDRASPGGPKSDAEKAELLSALVGPALLVEDPKSDLTAAIPVDELALEVVDSPLVDGALLDPMAYHLERDPTGAKPPELVAESRETGRSTKTTAGAGSTVTVTISTPLTKAGRAWLLVHGAGGTYVNDKEIASGATSVAFKNTALPSGDYLTVASVTNSTTTVSKLTLP
jgi:hypothetical protein